MSEAPKKTLTWMSRINLPVSVASFSKSIREIRSQDNNLVLAYVTNHVLGMPKSY